MALQQIKKVIVRDAIIENILQYIEENRLEIGDKIPSERTLASCLKVSRGSVREALKALEYSGILEIHHGGGAFLRSKSPFPLTKYCGDERENLVMLRHLLDARRMIEERVIVEATPTATAQQIRELYEMEERQITLIEKGLVEAGSKYELPNMNFELRITAMLRNPVILDMHQRLETAWKKAFRTIKSMPFPPRERYGHHIEIIKAIESSNVKNALKAMTYHNQVLATFIDNEIRKLDQRINAESMAD